VSLTFSRTLPGFKSAIKHGTRMAGICGYVLAAMPHRARCPCFPSGAIRYRCFFNVETGINMKHSKHTTAVHIQRYKDVATPLSNFASGVYIGGCT
jgi:hypothetical protein